MASASPEKHLPAQGFVLWLSMPFGYTCVQMELRHLRYFVTAAEELNISRASARLRISQPMNSWDDPGFRKAIEATGRKNILMTGLWTEVCITWPTIEMLGAGYNIYVVEDCCGATSPAAQEAALSRMVQAGAVRVTTIAALLEWQRDWKNKEHYNALMGILKQQGGAYGVGVEYAYTMVHHAAQAAQKPQVVQKTTH